MQARQYVADHRDPAVTDMQRASGIDAGELDLHTLAVAEIESPILSTGKRAQLRVIKFRREGEI